MTALRSNSHKKRVTERYEFKENKQMICFGGKCLCLVPLPRICLLTGSTNTKDQRQSSWKRNIQSLEKALQIILRFVTLLTARRNSLTHFPSRFHRNRTEWPNIIMQCDRNWDLSQIGTSIGSWRKVIRDGQWWFFRPPSAAITFHLPPHNPENPTSTRLPKSDNI